MEPVARRRLVLVGVGASLVLLLGSFALVQSRADASWTAMAQRADSMRESWRTRSHQREPIWGEAMAGSAFEHYVQAAESAQPWADNHTAELVKLHPMKVDEIPAAATEFRQRWQPVLRALHAGAHATDVRPLAEPGSAQDQLVANLLDHRWVCNFAMWEAFCLHAEGRDIDAVHITLDAATLGLDMLHDGILINQMIALALVSIATQGTWRDEVLTDLDPDALTVLARGLATIDERMPQELDMERELLFMASQLQQLDLDDPSLYPGGDWRHGFSTRWMWAEAFLLAADGHERMSRSLETSWPKRMLLHERQADAMLASGNEAAGLAYPNMVAAEQNLRQTLAQVRFLRMAVDRHRGLTAEPLPDPLGDGPLVVEPDDGGVMLKSAGTDERNRIERFVSR